MKPRAPGECVRRPGSRAASRTGCSASVRSLGAPFPPAAGPVRVELDDCAVQSEAVQLHPSQRFALQFRHQSRKETRLVPAVEPHIDRISVADVHPQRCLGAALIHLCKSPGVDRQLIRVPAKPDPPLQNRGQRARRPSPPFACPPTVTIAAPPILNAPPNPSAAISRPRPQIPTECPRPVPFCNRNTLCLLTMPSPLTPQMLPYSTNNSQPKG